MNKTDKELTADEIQRLVGDEVIEALGIVAKAYHKLKLQEYKEGLVKKLEGKRQEFGMYRFDDITDEDNTTINEIRTTIKETINLINKT